MAFEPGEILLDLPALPREMAFVLVAAVVRLKRGTVFLPPRALSGRTSPLTLAVHKLLCSLSAASLWRDKASLDAVGVGSLAPDIAFAGPRSLGEPFRERKTLLISLRGHQPYPSGEWLAGVSGWAESSGLRTVTFAQVRADIARNRQLASDLGGEYIEWEGDALQHEAKLRDCYSRASLVVSDRLHVLILSSLQGATPFELVESPRPKVREHFREIGLHGVSVDAGPLTRAEIAAHLEAQASPERNAEVVHCGLLAASRLEDAKSELRLSISESQG